MESVEHLINEFNEKFPVGASVRWRAIGKDGVPYRVYTVLYSAVDHNGKPVAWFRERSGMVPVDRNFVDYGN